MSVIITDSIYLDVNTVNLQFVSRSPDGKRLLFYSPGDLSVQNRQPMVLETDMQGSILNKFESLESDTSNVGHIVSALCYHPDGNLLLVTEVGVFKSDARGEFDLLIRDQVPTPLFLNVESSYSYINERPILLCIHDLDESIRFRRGGPEYFEKYRHFTTYDLLTKEISSEGKLPKNISYIAGGNDMILFSHVNAWTDSAAYVVHTPEQKMWRYDLSNKFAINSIPLHPEHFIIEDPTVENINLRVNFSSFYSSITAYQDTVIVTYTTGFSPEDVSPSLNMNDPQNASDLYAMHHKVHAIFIKKENKIARDLLLPRPLTGTITSLNNGTYLVPANDALQEIPNGKRFYIIRFEEQ